MGFVTSRWTKTSIALLLCTSIGLAGCAAPKNTSSPKSSSTSAQEDKTPVDTAFGTVKIPRKPQRVVALEGAVGPLLHAGITPLATASGDAKDNLLPEEYDKVKSLPKILTPDGWDYEKISAQKPDLIIGFVRAGKDEKISERSKQEYAKLSKIAPTAMILSEGAASTKEATLKISEALSDGEKAQQAKKKYADKASEIKEKYSKALEENTFAPVDYFEGTTTIYSPISWLGGILKDLGAKIAEPGASMTTRNGVDLSSEELTKLKDATVILTEEGPDGKPGEGASELSKVSTYQSLPAVKAKHSYGVPYFFADRYETALKVLERLEEILKKLS